MVPFDSSDFPGNVIATLIPKLVSIPGLDAVVARPIWNTDPDATAGMTAVDWTPREMEIGKHAGNSAEPTVSQYVYVIQGFIRHTDEIDGLAAISWLSKQLRNMVYRDPSTLVALSALSVTDGFGVTERFSRYGIRSQRFLTNEIQGAFLYMSALEMFVETETI